MILKGFRLFGANLFSLKTFLLNLVSDVNVAPVPQSSLLSVYLKAISIKRSVHHDGDFK
jgi:hypothetical protein